MNDRTNERTNERTVWWMNRWMSGWLDFRMARGLGRWICSNNTPFFDFFQLRHFVRNSHICFGIFSTTPLPKGVEVTIPFEFRISEYQCQLPCACAQDTCVVAKYNNGLALVEKKRGRSIGEDSNSGLHKMSPLEDSLTGNHSAQVCSACAFSRGRESWTTG